MIPALVEIKYGFKKNTVHDSSSIRYVILRVCSCAYDIILWYEGEITKTLKRIFVRKSI